LLESIENDGFWHSIGTANLASRCMKELNAGGDFDVAVSPANVFSRVIAFTSAALGLP
jgi:hypothetical protein